VPVWDIADNFGETNLLELIDYPIGSGSGTRMMVVERVWLDPLIPRRTILDAQILDPANQLLTVRTGTNFQLTPDEAARLAGLFPEARRPDVRSLEHHARSRASTREDPFNGGNWLEQVIAAIGATDASRLAKEILRNATHLRRPRQAARGD
jgi:hypothetical protein